MSAQSRLAERSIASALSVAERWPDTLQPLVEKIVCEAQVPGMVITAARGDGVPTHLVVGADAAGSPLAADTLFPVASITKLVTALAVLRLVAAGALDLDDTLEGHLPDSAAAGTGATVRDLLCHTSGLPTDLAASAAPYAPGLDWSILARACLATPLVERPRTRVRYSNLGAGMLAIVVERLTGQPFATALGELVLAPLGIEGYLSAEPPRAPICVGGALGEHAGSALEPYNSVFWRTLALPWGGLLTTAAGALALVRAFAGAPAGFLPPALLAEARCDQTGGLGGGMIGFLEWPRCPWGLGVELRGTKEPHYAPSAAAPASFGHGGASGCLAWYDPSSGVAWAMLGTCTPEGWWAHWPAIGAALLASADGDGRFEQE